MFAGWGDRDDKTAGSLEPGRSDLDQVHRLRFTVRGVVILLVVVLSGLALYFWVKSESVATTQFNRTQLTVAKLGASRLEGIIHHFENNLVVQTRLACDGSPNGLDGTGWPRSSLEDFRDLGGLDILHVDPDGRILSSLDIGENEGARLHASVLAGCQGLDPGDICTGTASLSAGGVQAEHVMVMTRRLPVCAGGGYLAYVVSWGRLGEIISDEISVGRFTLGWILDDEGTLMFHPIHEGMANRNIEDNDGTCAGCHEDFRIAKLMVGKRAGIDELDVKGSERKLVAYAPMQIGGRPWSMAVSAPYSVVVDENRRALMLAIGASALLVGLFLFVSYYLDRENRRHILALTDHRKTIEGLNAELEDKVKERTRELESLYEEVRTIQGRHDAHQRLAIVGELAAVVAHEIRTPLNSLAIGSKRLHRGLTGEGPISMAKVKRIVELQESEIQRINNYIEDYLRFSRMPSRRVERTDINPLVERLVRFCSVDGARHGIVIHFDAGIERALVDVDEEQITQVLLNLLVNAIQAMPGGGDVFVRTDVENEQILVLVRDTGAGIAGKLKEDVFKPFFTTKKEGTGLGLAISARIIKENHGSIDCDSEEGHGTTFCIRLPKAG